MPSPLYTCLWFNQNARQAADYYCTIFTNSRIISDNGMVVMFELQGTLFMGLNGGPQYRHSPAVSFVIECANQQEIDYYWAQLGAGGRYDRCGWLADKFGISWQVVPAVLKELMANPHKREAVTQAFLQMGKFDIATLEAV